MKVNGEENGGSGGTVGGNGGAVVGSGEGEGDPSEYPKETEDFCSVCGDIYSYDDNNEIIYCDGCNVAVHQGMPASLDFLRPLLTSFLFSFSFSFCLLFENSLLWSEQGSGW